MAIMIVAVAIVVMTMSVVIVCMPIMIVTVTRFGRTAVIRGISRPLIGRFGRAIDFPERRSTVCCDPSTIIGLRTKSRTAAVPPTTLPANGSPRRLNGTLFALLHAAIDDVPSDTQRACFIKHNRFQFRHIGRSSDDA